MKSLSPDARKAVGDLNLAASKNDRANDVVVKLEYGKGKWQLMKSPHEAGSAGQIYKPTAIIPSPINSPFQQSRISAGAEVRIRIYHSAQDRWIAKA